MLIRLIVLVVLVGIAVAIALLLQRRRPEPPSAPSYRVPRQVDRADFGVSEPVMVAVFSSTTCHSCAGVWEHVGAIRRPLVGTVQFDVQTHADLHKRYKIDGVPTTIVADRDGVVHGSFFGPLNEDALAEVLDRMTAEGN